MQRGKNSIGLYTQWGRETGLRRLGLLMGTAIGIVMPTAL